MSMIDWARAEIELACKRENPNWDGKSFDYGCSCYMSALKAYESLCDDGHSGYSFSMTRSILNKLMDGHPLSPITDEDFFINQNDEYSSLETDESLHKRGLKSDIQCPRMSSLFRYEYLDGAVKYHDVDRAVCVNIEEPDDRFSGSLSNIIDEIAPITMPYSPAKGKYKIYVQTFLVDKKNGDYDTEGIYYIEDPDGKRIDYQSYRTTGPDGNWVNITREEYDKLLAKRLDPIHKKVAEHLMFTLLNNSCNDEEEKRRCAAWSKLGKELQDKIYDEFEELCKFFDDPDHWKLNTFDIAHALVRDHGYDYTVIEQYPELGEISKFLRNILIKLNLQK